MTAAQALGVSLKDFCDAKKCTALLDIKKLCQPVFVCLQCGDGRVFCRGCKNTIHRGHSGVIGLGQRRGVECETNLNCDINDKELSPANVNNTLINTCNRAGRFCYCKRQYTSGDQGEMWQCAGCEDWFHVNCISDGEDLVDPFRCRDCTSVGNIQQDTEEEEYVEIMDEEEHEELISTLNEIPEKFAVLEGIHRFNEWSGKVMRGLAKLPKGHVVTAHDIALILEDGGDMLQSSS